jgi:diadenosine tetraphosphatase ApaH/serine/threonine PP2A family protein phosphatase
MRIAVVSDIHSNLPALEAVVAAVGAVDAWWHLGDVVGYGPHPDEVVARLRALGATGVLGNHDAAALGDSIVDDFNQDAKAAARWTRSTISSETRAWLKALPEVDERASFTLVHGSPLDPIWEYVTSLESAEANIDAIGTRWCLHGHTHKPKAWREATKGGPVDLIATPHGETLVLDERRMLLNPGSVGQPRDGDPRASYLILDTDAGTSRWGRVPYPIAETQAAMRAVRLPERLWLRLEIGR